MDDLKTRCTALWDQLVMAMRQDGLLAQCVTQSGPATTAVIVGLVGKKTDAGWMSMGIVPQPNRQVLAQDDDGNYHIAWCVESAGCSVWCTHLDEYSARLQQWRYIETQL